MKTDEDYDMDEKKKKDNTEILEVILSGAKETTSYLMFRVSGGGEEAGVSKCLQVEALKAKSSTRLFKFPVGGVH